jgi:hypothetical protein
MKTKKDSKKVDTDLINQFKKSLVDVKEGKIRRVA